MTLGIMYVSDGCNEDDCKVDEEDNSFENDDDDDDGECDYNWNHYVVLTPIFDVWGSWGSKRAGATGDKEYQQ